MDSYKRKLITICFYIALTVIAIMFAVLLMAHINDVAIALIKALGLIGRMLFPLFAAFLISFIFDPIVGFFDKKAHGLLKNRYKKTEKRVIGTAVTYIVMAVVIIGLFASAFFSMPKGVGEMSHAAAGIMRDVQEFVEGIKGLVKNTGFFRDSDSVFMAIEDSLSYRSQRWLFSAAEGVTGAGGFVLKTGIGFVIAFYLLMDKNILLKKVYDFSKTVFKKPVFDKLYTFICDVNTVFSGYISGQITDAFIMAVLIGVSLWIIGVKYAFLIGIISGFSNLIPYLGAIMAFTLAILASLISGDTIKAVYAAITILILQQLDTAVIVPRIVGKRVKLHPIIVLVSLSAAGSVFGILGMVFAVPVAALLKLNFDRFYERKKTRIE